MRDIEFRGKEVFDNKGNRPAGGGKWLHGSLITHGDGIVSIVGTREDGRTKFNYDVIPETVGEYTGLKDKNGVKIFEGDILNRNNSIAVAEWDSPRFIGFQYIKGKHNQAQTEIIGNIHDNPELLGGCK